LHRVTGDLTIPSGKTLTIQPGAVVKFASKKGIEVPAGGTLNASAPWRNPSPSL